MRRILAADDHEITGADFDLHEILSVASELKDIPRGREWFRVAIERMRNTHRPGLDVHGEAAPFGVSKAKGDLDAQQNILARPVGWEKKSSRPLCVDSLVPGTIRRSTSYATRLSDISDDRLLSFGLTAQDIVLLRGTPIALAEATAGRGRQSR